MKKIKSTSNLNLYDEIFELNQEFNLDKRKEKINCGIGVYLDDYGKPYVLPVIKKVASSLEYDNFNYLPISGDNLFLRQSSKLVFGESLFNEYENRLVSQGVIGGTNGLFMWANLMNILYIKPTIIISNPTWENHKKIFNYFKFNIIEYNHLNKQNLFDYSSFKKTVEKHPNSIVLLHGGPTHNPTGVNPSKEQWRKIMNLMKKNNMYACFDFAYMGLGEGIENDCYAMRLFAENAIKFALIISYSKNMSLYQHRTGVLITSVVDNKEKATVQSIIKYLFRVVNSNPAAFGEIVARTILENDKLKNVWTNSVDLMRSNLDKRRKLFDEYTKHRFHQVVKQKGLFSLLYLNPNQIKKLKDESGIYLLSNSRINFGGLSIEKIPTIAKAILSII